MALPYQGGARFPGVAGFSDGVMGWQIPGVLGFKQQELGRGKGAATKSIKSVAMPPPWNNSDAKRVGGVGWKLSKGDPTTDDVKQGGLPNCPVAAIIAALAHTSAGQKYLNELVVEFTGAAIKTTVSAEIIAMVDASTPEDPDNTSGVPDYKPQAGEIVSNRYFTVGFWKGEIPDTFYIQYSDNSFTKPVFMGSPNEVLWPAVIEKACAMYYGSYKELGNYHKHKANEHWKLVMGKDPQGFEINSSTSLDKIMDAADNAAQIPTIAASKEDAPKITRTHGFAVLGRTGRDINLYNPYGEHKTITPEEFRDNFQTVLFGMP